MICIVHIAHRAHDKNGVHSKLKLLHSARKYSMYLRQYVALRVMHFNAFPLLLVLSVL